MINDADISENQLLHSYGEKVCMNLLKDHTTQQNIYWATIIRKTKCYRFTKRNVPKRKTKRLRYRGPPESYSNSVRTDFFSYSNAIILENLQTNTSI